MHPNVNIAAIADDTYLNGEGERDGAVFDCFADKRTEARKINLESKLRKVGVFSPRADLSLAPPDLPGSPHYGDGARLDYIKVAGTLVGDPAVTSPVLCAIISKRLSNLATITCLRDDLHTVNVAQLQSNLLRLCASATLAPWASAPSSAVTTPLHLSASAFAARAIIASRPPVRRLDASPHTRGAERLPSSGLAGLHRHLSTA